jgi:aromatic ring-opening dioxygenase catalytic subunit (LigB family)
MEQTMNPTTRRTPVAFVSHGGGPWPILDVAFPQEERASLLQHLRDVSRLSAAAPKALIVISAHWEEPVPTVMSSAKPSILYDYYGFPPEAYTLTWPAPGSPVLAGRVRELLAGGGFATAEDAGRGYDHGTFVPMKVAFPEADIPVVQLSLIQGLDASEHLKMGHALAPLRDEGVLVVGTGNTFHNLQALRASMQGAAPGARERAATFDDWLQAAVTGESTARDDALRSWEKAPFARFAQPREEHLLPLMVVAGAAGGDRGVTTWSGSMAGLRGSAFRFG